MTSRAPGGADRRVPVRDRVILAVARAMSRRFFRSVEVVGPRDLDGPVIVAASHLNGFVDPVLLVAALGRLPRFLAKATLWRVLPARPFLALARIVPVHRRQDQDGSAPNVAMFASVVEALARGDTVALFPEGTTHDRPHLVELRTGVARMAVQAVDSGVAGVRIVPVGVAYEDKVALRGRALVEFGEPIDVAADAARLRQVTDDEHEVVRGLMATIDASLRAVSPDFASLDEALALGGAAKVAVRARAADPRVPVPLATSATLARRLVRAAESVRTPVVDAMARYQLVLADLGLHDEDVARSVGARVLARRVAVLVAAVVVLAPLALAGVMANIVPVALVVVAGLVPHAPVTKGTVRLLVALVAFPATWLAIAWFDVGGAAIADVTRVVTFPIQPLLDGTLANRSGFLRSLVVFVVAPVFGLVALFVIDAARQLVSAWQSWRTVLDRRGQLDELRVLRAVVLDRVEGVVPQAPVSAVPAGPPGPGEPPAAPGSEEPPAPPGPGEPPAPDVVPA
jgi:glycerol-3-phosphate O-acyltransferase / dihydroxyacetone phosphate acyltransferase